MATKRKRVMRAASRTLRPSERHLFETGEYNDMASILLSGDLARRDPAAVALWERHREVLLQDWISAHPGTRPWAWWALDAPRWALSDMPARVARPDAAWVTAGELCEPRRRLGGIGTPSFEALNTWPRLWFGLPASWVTARQVAYCNGRARDIHGRPIGTEYHEGQFPYDAIDAHDPPRFESEAAYLDRHGLLSADERHRLPADAFEAETVPPEVAA